MMESLFVFSLFACIVLAVDLKAYEVVKVSGLQQGGFDLINSMIEKHSLDVWSTRYDLGEMDILVHDQHRSLLSGFNVSTVLSDVQSYLDQSKLVPFSFENEDSDAFYDNYRSYAQSVEKMNSLCTASDLCTPFILGKTVEGRDILGYHVAGGSGGKEILINGNIHAREWVSPATVIYVMDHLLNEYDTNPVVKSLVDQFIWTLIPVTNVDGRLHSENTRMWRKNRRPNQGGSFGVDLNRNFEYKWNQGGSSNNPASDTYHGTGPISEPEAAALQNYACSKNGNVVAYLDVHTHGNMFMSPWGWTNAYPPTYDEMMNFAKASVAKIEATHGAKWKVGTSNHVIYLVSGGAKDCFYELCKVPYSYTMELRGPGFSPPASAIRLSCEEIWNGFVAMGEYLQNKDLQ